MRIHPSVKIAAAFAAIYVLWGSTYLAIALGVQSIPPLLLMGTRSLIGGALLLGWAKLPWGPSPAMHWPSGKAWAHAAVCGLLFFLGCHGLLAYGEQHLPSGLAAILLATIPFWIVVLNFLFPVDERPRALTLLALVPGFAGVALIAWREATRTNAPSDPIMILVLLVSALSWAAGSIISQHRVASLPATAVSGMQLLCGGVALVVSSWLTGELSGFAVGEVTGKSIAGLAYLIVAGSLLAFAAYIWLLGHVSAPLVSTYTFVNPIIAVCLGWAFLGERLTPEMFAGTALIIASVIAVGLLDMLPRPKGSPNEAERSEAGHANPAVEPRR